MVSEVWQHFRKVRDGSRAVCQYCKKILSRNNGSTFALISHLSRVHNISVKTRKMRQIDIKMENVQQTQPGESSSELNTEEASSKSSRVWEHFYKTESKEAICMHCSSVLKCKNGSTSGIINHLKTHNIYVQKRNSKSLGNPEKLTKMAKQEEEPQQHTLENFVKFEEIATESVDDVKSEELILKSQRHCSDTWNHFDKTETGDAKCKICSKLIQRRDGSTTGMICHLKLHNITCETNSEPLNRTKTFTSLVWKYFVKLEDSRAMCKTCRSIILRNDGSTNGMISHLKIHNIIIPKRKPQRKLIDNADDSEDSTGVEASTKNDNSNGSGSVVWKHFKKNADGSATCNVCAAVIKRSRGSTFGMKYHLKIHNISLESNRTSVVDSFESSDMIDEEFEPEVKSTLWDHFDKIEKNKSKCRHCTAFIRSKSGSTSGMIRHLESKHKIDIFQNESSVQIETSSFAENLNLSQIVEKKVDKCRLCMEEIGNEETFQINAELREIFEQITGTSFKSFNDYSTLACETCFDEFQKFTSLKQRLMEKQEEIEKLLQNQDHSTIQFEQITIKEEKMDYADFYQSSEIYLQEEKTTPQSDVADFSMHKNRESTVISNIAEKPLQISHGSDETYLCDHCGKDYNSREAIRKHLNIHRSLVRSKILEMSHFKCPCGLKFLTKNEMKEHAAENHPTKNFLICHICAKSFAFNGELEVHMRRHLNIRPFVCDFEGCGKAFHAKEILKNHRNRTHKDLSICHICSKRTKHMENHMQLHTGYRFKCDYELEGGKICDKTFLTNSLLRNHLAKHKNLLRFDCGYCGKTYFRKNSYLKHVRTEHLNFRVACTVYGCQSMFVCKENLKAHIKSVHKNLSSLELDEALAKASEYKLPPVDTRMEQN